MTINAGDLRYRVAVKIKTIFEDNESIVAVKYVDAGHVWADITPIGGEIAQRKYGVVDDAISMKLITRPNKLIVEGNVVVWNGKNYEIRYVATSIYRYESLLKSVQSQ